MSDMGLGLELGLEHEAAALAPAVDAAQLTEAIRAILKDADLEQLSRRMVRKQLEAQFQTDLSHYKDTINESILRLIEEQQGDEEEDDDEEDEDEPEPSEEDEDADDEEEPKPKRKRAAPKKKPAAKKRARKAGDDEGGKKAGGGFNMQLALSPELASVVGADRMARPQIVKALWAYIREHNLQDPNNKKSIIFDDKLRSVFQRDSVTMFSMNKFVKRHVRKPDELPPGGWDDIPRDGVSSDEDESAKAKKKPAAKRKKASGGDEKKKSNRASPFNKELVLSPELASVVGAERMARPQIVKTLWAYIHEHNLQSPNDKRTIVLDSTLRRVFQRDTFTMFSMNKFVKRHVRKPEEMPANGWDDILRDGVSSDDDEKDRITGRIHPKREIEM